MRNKRLILALVLAVLWAISPSWGAPARSAILMIGDGMGGAHVQVAGAYERFLGRCLTIEEMMAGGPGGLVSTFSANRPITDSAAAGTALATGVKTNNGMLGVRPDGTPVETILEQCKKAGKAVGLATKTGITHATPAAFAVHVSSRGEEDEIAVQELAAHVDLMLGGGKRAFLPESMGGGREDGRNLLQEAQQAGYTVATGGAQLAAARSLPLLGLFAESELGYTIDRPKGEPTLAEMTAKALELLSEGEQGFFLMVEGGEIDFGAHANDLATMIYELLAFDQAVRVAKDFAAAHPDTLVIVTADHETGGLTLAGLMNWDIVQSQSESAEQAIMAVARSEKVSLEQLRAAEQRLGARLSVGERARLLRAGADWEEVGSLLARKRSERAGVRWSSFDHTAAWVPVVGTGPGSERLHALQDNTDIPGLLRWALGISVEQAAAGAASPAMPCCARGG
jgi:alkaline phosphatase